jgi:bifunctional non-homologous end joining protein LigD
MSRPDRLRPMLAATTDRLPAGDDWRFELKLDGYRIVAEVGDGPARLWSRGGHDYAGRFPEVAEHLAAAVDAPCAVDGEVCALDPDGRPSFQRLQSGAGPQVFFAFDLLELDGRAVTGRPLAERRELLEETLREDAVVRVSRAYDDGPGLLELARSRGLEGVMAKRVGSRYRPGRRSQDWRKLKLRVEGAFVVCGYLAGSGSRGALGSLVLAERGDDGALRWVGEAGSGLSGPEADRLLGLLRPLERAAPVVARTPRGHVTWVEPRLRARVEFAERTADGRLRAPVYLGLEEPPPRRRRAPEPELTNLDKPFFPEDGVTKGDLIEYYRGVAPALVEHLSRRPFTMLRFPDGIHGKRFFQKDAPVHTPRWVRTSLQDGVRYLLVNDLATLLWAVNMGCIDMHAWSARADRPDRPDWVMFDLDPAEGTGFGQVVEVARLLRHALHGLDLEGYPKTSGSKGLHVLVPIERRCDQAQVRAFATAVARALERTAPELITSAWKKRERHGVLVDVNQNGWGRTTAAVYSVRPRPGAPVSAPIGWDEIGPELDPAAFTMAEVTRRLRRRGDLFGPVLAHRQRLPRL